MIDDATETLLHDILRRESRSLLQYVREVPVWSSRGDLGAVATIKQLATAEIDCVDALGKYLLKAQAGLSHLGTYPSGFTTLNDAALGFLLPKVLTESERLAKDLDRDLANVADDGARDHLRTLVGLKAKTRAALADLHPSKYVFNKV